MSSTIITKPKVDIAPSILKDLETRTKEEGQVVLHFILHNSYSESSLIRIWPSSYLFDLDSSHSSDLVHVENITLFPTWKPVPANTTVCFTLIFSGLPKSCTAFQFVEDCKGSSGAWSIDRIQRNEQDVYFLRID